MKTISPDCLRSIRKGDHLEFQKFYLDTVDALVSFVNMLVHSESEAEEICQQVYVTIWENREVIDPSGNFMGYLYKVAKTAAFRSIARRKVQNNYINFRLNHGIDLGTSPDEFVITDETALIISIALAHMPEQRRKVFEMSRYDGLCNDEISEKLNITPATVRSHLSHALKELREMLAILSLLSMI